MFLKNVAAIVATTTIAFLTVSAGPIIGQCLCESIFVDLTRYQIVKLCSDAYVDLTDDVIARLVINEYLTDLSTLGWFLLKYCLPGCLAISLLCSPLLWNEKSLGIYGRVEKLTGPAIFCAITLWGLFLFGNYGQSALDELTSITGLTQEIVESNRDVRLDFIDQASR